MNEPDPSQPPGLAPFVRAGRREQFRNSVLVADWPAPPHVRAFTTLRGPAGDSEPPFDSLDLGVRGGGVAAAMRNRHELRFHLDLPSPPHWLQQVHGTDVIAFERPAQHRGRDVDGDDWTNIVRAEPVADAAVTTAPGVVLAILTADCLPVLFCSRDGDEVGAAHAGWRGLASGVLEATITAMHAPPDRLLAWLGPAAGSSAYEVADEVRAAFVDGDANAASAFAATRPGHWFCDLYALARMRLARSGVGQVFGGGLCTISDPQRFYSHRRDQVTGRMATLIWRS